MGRLLLIVIASLGISIRPGIAAADLTHTLQFNIGPEDLPTALLRYSQQSGVQVTSPSKLIEGKASPGAVGTFAAQDALEHLLIGTQLSYQVINKDTVAIVAQSFDTAESKSPQEGSGSSSRFRVAQVDQGTAASSSSIAGEEGGRSPGQNPGRLEEVVVTAQKRTERLLDVPISIAVMTNDELEQRHITSLEDLSSVVPNLSYSNLGTTRSFVIRGISNSAAGSSSLIGLYIDEADVTLGGAGGTQIDPNTYDLDRVEVLRGPQGTLYGEGSAGGTIRFITKSPDLNRTAFDSQLTAQFTERGGSSQRINTVLNAPLIGGQLGLRVAGTFEHDGGWIDLAGTDQQNINARDLTNVRVKGLWQPHSDLTVSAMAIINRNSRSTDTSDIDAPTQWTQVFGLSAAPRLKNDYDLYNLTVSYDFSSIARILNTTSYLTQSAPQRNQGTKFSPFDPTDPPEFYAPTQQMHDRLLTDELRLASVGNGALQWTLGGFYRHYSESVDVPLNYFGPLNDPASSAESLFATSYDQLYRVWSAFGDASYRMFDRLTIGVGARYFGERQKHTDNTTPIPTQKVANFHSVDPRIHAQLMLTKDLNVYASAAKGFRSGGFNVADLPVYGPESVWAYEFGTKMALMDNHVSFDAAFFLTNYLDYLTFGTNRATGVAYDFNAGRARIKGVEADLMWHPFPQWHFDVRGAYLNARFTEIDATKTPHEPGDELDNVPRYHFTLSGQREFSWLGKQASARLDYSQQGPQSIRDRTGGPLFYGESDTIKSLSFNTSMFLRDNLRVGVFAQNLLNDDGYVNAYSFIGQGVRSRPRTYGVEFALTSE